MPNLISRFHAVSKDFLDHVSEWKDRPDVMAFVLNFIVILVASIERLSDNGAIKYNIVNEIMNALETYQETLKDD